MLNSNFPNQQMFDLSGQYRRLKQQLQRLEKKANRTPFETQRMNGLKRQLEDIRGQVGGYKLR